MNILQINTDVNILDKICVFWEVDEDDRGTGTWSEEGCLMMSNESGNNQIVCRCTHLTSFAVLFVSVRIEYTIFNLSYPMCIDVTKWETTNTRQANCRSLSLLAETSSFKTLWYSKPTDSL